MSEELEFDLEKEVNDWRDGAVRDLRFAGRLIEREEEEIPYCFFFLHLTLEKALKAHVVKHTKKPPPKIHNLPILAEMGAVQMSQEQNDFCGRINRYNIEPATQIWLFLRQLCRRLRNILTRRRR